MTVKTISPDNVRTPDDGAGSTAIDERELRDPQTELLRSAPPLTASTLWSMIEAETAFAMFLAEGGGEVPLFEPEEAPDDAFVSDRTRALPPEGFDR